MTFNEWKAEYEKNNRYIRDDNGLLAAFMAGRKSVIDESMDMIKKIRESSAKQIIFNSG